jgi:hypothetical protein
VIQHAVVSPGTGYDRLAVRNVEVRVRDDDTPDVWVFQGGLSGTGAVPVFVEDGRTLVLEGDQTTGIRDELRVQLAKAPAAGTVVVLDVQMSAATDQQILLTNLAADSRLTFANGRWQVTFNATNWNQQVRIGVEARDDAMKEDPATVAVSFVRNDTLTTDANWVYPNLRAPVERVEIRVLDNDTPGGLALQTDGSTILVPNFSGTAADETITDSYALRLTRQPVVSANVAVLTDGLADVVTVNGQAATYVDIGTTRFSTFYENSVTFSNGGVGGRGLIQRNITGSFIEEGFRVGELIGIANADVNHNGTFTIFSVSATQIVLTQAFSTAAVVTDTFVTLGEMTREGEFQGTARYFGGGLGAVTRTEGGWLQDGFLEGMRVRMTFGNVSGIFKIQTIGGDNATKDNVIIFVNDGTLPTINSDTQAFTITRVAAQVTFSANNWYIPQTIVMRADPFYVLPEVFDEVLVSHVRPHLLSELKGPIEFEGGATGADRSLNAAAKLPGELDAFLIPVGPQSAESRQVDVLTIFADGSLQNLNGKTDHVSVRGFGLPDGVNFNLAAPIFGETGAFADGIGYGKLSFIGGVRVAAGDVSSVEVVNLLLGQGDDVVDTLDTLRNESAIVATAGFVFTSAAGGGSIARAGFDFAAAGFRPGQTLTIGGVTGSWTIVSIGDAGADPNDNSILNLSGPALPVLAGPRTLTATDPLVSVTLAVTVVASADGGTMTRAAGSWLTDGFSVGDLVYVSPIPNGTRWRVGAISSDGRTLTLEGPSLNQIKNDTYSFSLPGPHGGLTMIHGGGNQLIQLTGQLHTQAGTTRLTRLDGLSWLEPKFAVNMQVQLSGDVDPTTGAQLTRTITAIENASGGVLAANSFVGAGAGSTLVLSGSNFTATGASLRTLTATVPSGEFTVARIGGDFLTVTGGGGPTSPLVLYGDTSQDGTWYAGRNHHVLGSHFGQKPFDAFASLPAFTNEDADWIMPIADLYKRAGNDTIIGNTLFAALDPGSLPTVGFVGYGGAGNDILFGSQAGDHLAGGGGNDGILGLRGNDIIIGDSGINVDFTNRAMRYATVDASPSPGLDPAQLTNGTFMRPAPSPMRDRMIAGADVLGGDSSGSAPLTDASSADIIGGDHIIVTQNVADPHLPSPLPQRIQTTGAVTSIVSTTPHNGQADVIAGNEGNDTIIGGPGVDNINGGGQAGDVIFQDGTPMVAAAAPAVPVTVAPLTAAEAEGLLAAARRIWARSGLVSTEQLAATRDVTVEVLDLPGLTLGNAAGGVIQLDLDAAGHGWFVDPTPLRNEEFRRAGGELVARDGSVAGGRMDLLTVVVHELGHLMGFVDGQAGVGPMAATLDVGQRIGADHAHGLIQVPPAFALGAARVFAEAVGDFVEPAWAAALREVAQGAALGGAAAPRMEEGGAIDWSQAWRPGR